MFSKPKPDRISPAQANSAQATSRLSCSLAVLPFTLPVNREECVTGDLRNKLAKQERDRRHREWLAKKHPLGPIPSMVTLVCQGCLHNHSEKQLYSYQLDRWRPNQVWCQDCMPEDIKAVFGFGTDQAPPG